MSQTDGPSHTESPTSSAPASGREGNGFDAADYWERRLGDRYSFQGVGNIGFSEAYNRWMYRAKGHAFRAEVRRVLPDPATARILDIGSGTGFVLRQWLQLGCRDVTGSDLTKTAVEKLTDQLPDVSMVQMDIGRPEVPLAGPFDIISAIDVFYHIVDDGAYVAAFRNVADLLSPKGHFVFTEMCTDSGGRSRHVSRRSWTQLLGVLNDSGLEIVRRKPLYVWMEAPLRARGLVYRGAWKVTSRIARGPAPLGMIGGGLLFPLEIVSRRVVKAGPGLEIFTCKKTGGVHR